MVGEARVQFGEAIATKRKQQREGFRGKTLSVLKDDEMKEKFAPKRSIEQASLRVEKFAPKSRVNEQYMKKVSGVSKSRGFRSQYGM
jgi:hypothetical protein